jgi:dTDP-4-dehydrorhamnose reductase
LLDPELKNKKFLIVGKDGQVGYELCSRLLGEGVELRSLGRDDCNLLNSIEVRQALEDIPYDILINASAYNFVDRAESEQNQAFQINAEIPKLLALDAAEKGARIVHYSTDYVFDGKKADPYTEADAPNPLNTYGRSKLAGEENLVAANPDHLIFRVSWVYSLRRHNFLKTMLRLARERNEIRVVNDQIGTPSWARTIANLTLDALSIPSGIYHLAPGNHATWFEFACSIFDSLHGRLNKTPMIVPIPSSEFASHVARPQNSRFCTTKFELSAKIKLQDWKLELVECLKDWQDLKS